MQKTSLTALARNELRQALEASSGRSASTVYGGHEHRLRQTLIAMRAGEWMSEHENPGEATLQVIEGRVLLWSGDVSWNGSPGDLMIIPEGSNAVEIVEDSVLLLTVVKTLGGED
ncbi:MAG: cupin 2 conserved barrel domain protein [Microbacteriaceae bacterium]|nr:cupin 2 conserved barrel domain protein [Microbacteriaceae bacterium]